MSIAYTYEIVSVDQQARVMEVVYTSPGRQTMHISARLPFVGESLEAVINMFSPVAYWREQEAEVVVPNLGSGSVNPDAPPPQSAETLDEAKKRKRALIATARYEREIAGVASPSGNLIGTDREDQSKIAGAVAAVQAGFITSVDWKFGDGIFVTLTAEQILNVGRMVTQHVQEQFTWEKLKAAEVEAATTIEAVNAIEV